MVDLEAYNSGGKRFTNNVHVTKDAHLSIDVKVRLKTLQTDYMGSTLDSKVLQIDPITDLKKA